MKTIKSFRIVDHGPDHAQYFPGHGVAFTRYTDCATGCGFTASEALDDALDQLAQNDWDISPIDNAAERREIDGNKKTVDDWHECSSEEERETCEHYWYVSIDVSEGEA